MGANLSAQPSGTRELRLAGRLATRKSRLKSLLQQAQGIIAGLEYATYIATFVLLFAWKVAAEHLTAAYRWHVRRWPDIPVIDDYALFLVVFLVLYWYLLYQKQFYDVGRERSLSEEAVAISRSMALAFLITIGLTFLIKNTMIYSRLMMVTFAALIVLEGSAFRYLRKWTFHRLKTRGLHQQNVLIIGAGRVGNSLLQRMNESRSTGYQFVGYLDDDVSKDGVIGRIADLETIIHRYDVDIIYITIPSERELVHSILQRFYKYDVDIRIIPEQYDQAGTVFEYCEGKDLDYPYLQLVKTPLRGFNLLLKRTMDIAGSSLAIILLSPLFALIALLIKLDSPGPVLFKQKRIGKNGAPFQMYKFRSMVHDAEAQKKKLKKLNEMDGPVFKIRQDPRVTRVGAFLRKYSLDELPQLFNVVVGQMSLIGPRPPLPEEVARYSDHHWRRLDVRPGMTGLWQVSGRSNLSFEEWTDLDIQYIERWSIGLELRILLKTIPVVLKGKGAY